MKKYAMAVCDGKEYYADELYNSICAYANERKFL